MLTLARSCTHRWHSLSCWLTINGIASCPLYSAVMLRSVLLCACLLPLISPSSGTDEFNSHQGGLRRSVEFKRGRLETSRQLQTRQSGAAAASRQLLPTHADDAHKVWVLGIGSHHHQQEVLDALEAQAGQLLHGLPGQGEDSLHWLIRCSEAAISTLLAAHEHVTVAEFPTEYKRAQSVDTWQEQTQGFRGSGKWPATLQDSPKQLHRYLTRSGQELTAAVLALLPKISEERITALQAAVDQQLSALLQQHPSCTHHQPVPIGRALRVTVCMQLVSEVATLLSEQVEVTWVELEPKMVLHDLYANVAGQAPQTFSGVYPAPNVQGGVSTTPAAYPYWAAGIDGTGEVVGVVDSGADMDSCYLWDPNFPNYTQYSTVFSSGPPVMQGFQSDAHRKVAMYVFMADKVDSTEGHGTHVSTAIVGAPFGVANPARTPDQATGVAPNAKLAMFDLGIGDNQVDAQLLVSQGQLAYNTMYDVLQKAGARVMSNSWGLAGGESAQTDAAFCALFDQYAVDNPNLLLVFAAGNDGNAIRALPGNSGFLVSRQGTITTPGACKNTLTVGATNNFIYKGLSEWVFPMRSSTGQQVSLSSNQFLGAIENGQLWFTDSTSGRRLGIPYSIVNLPGYDSSMFPLQGKEISVVVAQPADACGPLDPATFAAVGSAPAAVLFKRTGASCNLTDAARNVLTNSQVFAAFPYYDNDIAGITADNFSITAVPGMDGKPGAVVWKQLADFIQSGLSRDPNAITVTWKLPDSNGATPIDNLASFSSYGSPLAFTNNPRVDMLKKPDLVAPGYTLAAKSDGTYSGVMDSCNVFTLQGTSMATPQVAGAALLARQYFLQGFYPSGAPSSNSHEPSGPLMKALMVAGTAAMQGSSEATQQPLGAPPDPFQGFGRMDLSSSLPLADDKLGWSLQVIDQAPLSTTGDSNTYTVSTIPNDSSGRPLIVVLVWNDQPAFPGASGASVNNLDLLVQDINGTKTYFPNGMSGPERVNNVEKVYVANPGGKRYKITVTATQLGQPGTQPYSLVVLGSNTSPLNSQFNPANGVIRTPPQVAPRSPPPSDASTAGAPNNPNGPSQIRQSQPAGNHGGCKPLPGILLSVVLSLVSLCFLSMA